jgi:hypothetical protein
MGIVGGLLFTASTYRRVARATRVSNAISLTAAHRDIWKLVLADAHLEDVFEPAPTSAKVSAAQKVFLRLMVVHMASVYEAYRSGTLIDLTGLQRDIGEGMAAPLAKEVWEQLRPYQNRKFTAFVEEAIRQHGQKADPSVGEGLAAPTGNGLGDPKITMKPKRPVGQPAVRPRR